MRRMGGVAGVVAMAAVTVAWLGSAPVALAGERLDAIKEEGLLRCGVTRSGIGLSETDEYGDWQGFFPAFCRALAAALFGDPEAVEYIEVDDVIRFEALRDDAFDVLMANTTWTTTRDSDLGLTFTETLYYDGQSFLAHKSLGAESLADVEEASVCVGAGTTTIQNLEEYAATHPGITVQAYDSIEGVHDAFFSRACDMLTYDRVTLLSQLYSRAARPANYVLFPDIISKEPLGPVIARGDVDWFDVVRWVTLAMIAAEELGVTSENVEAMLESPVPEVRRLLGVEGDLGEKLGLPQDWGYQVISQIGNYGEVFDQTIGADSRFGLERGINAQWRDGGLMYAPPVR